MPNLRFQFFRPKNLRARLRPKRSGPATRLPARLFREEGLEGGAAPHAPRLQGVRPKASWDTETCVLCKDTAGVVSKGNHFFGLML